MVYTLYALGPSLYKIKAAALVNGTWKDVVEKPVVLGLTNATPSFLERNPRGQVPTLEVEGGSIVESNAICRYLCNESLSRLSTGKNEYAVSSKPVYPRDPMTRALVDCWLDIDCELFLTVKDVFDLLLGFKKGDKRENVELRKKMNDYLNAMETKLRESTYLVGDFMTLADIVLFVDLSIYFLYMLKKKDKAKKFPCLSRWFSTMAQHPAMKESIGHLLSGDKMDKDEFVYEYPLDPKVENPAKWLFPEIFGEEKWSGARTRQAFLDFFELKGHTFVRSSPVVPHDDPTLLFANAGMNQFKPIFMGKADPNSQLGKLKRATNTQKCIRAGGKHNDLDDVGKDTYHHTFFEMLGNWSFGDFFKVEAINWAWELLTKVYKLPADRMYATYFGGNKEQGLEPDNEARDIWLKILPASQVMPFGTKDNFWEMGDTGPCGPCTELHFDRVGGRDASSMVNMDDPSVIEIWNLVFIQYNREPSGKLKPLPNKHVDTGMGFERIASVLQNKMSNYDTDIFVPIFDEIQTLTQAPREYRGGVGPVEDPDNVDMAYRVIADHIRTLCISIADGARPGNEGREYVLRRVLRRAVRYGREVLKAKEGFFSKLVPIVVRVMGDVFPELEKHQAKITEIIAEEEKSFGRTLTKGIERFKKASKQVLEDHKASKSTKTPMLAGAEAFVLWDTFGFPVDLTQLMAEEYKMGVDMDGFNAAMEEAKEKSRAGGKNKGGAGAGLRIESEQTAHLKDVLKLAPTQDNHKFSDKDVAAKVCAILSSKSNSFIDKVEGDEVVALVVDATSFYAEMGGQVADSGVIEINGGKATFQVMDAKTAAGYVFHIGKLQKGSACKGDSCTVKVDYTRRHKISNNHTCTHLLNLALRANVSEDVQQKGSLVDDEKLRFDFNNNKPVDAKKLSKIEKQIKGDIDKGLQVFYKEVSLKDGKDIHGLRAVFGETYPDPVRVVSIGKPVDALLKDPKSPENYNYSVEFCGGTHLANTKEAESFAILSEEGIAKGVRRIAAATGKLATEAHKRGSELKTKAGKLDGVKDATALQAELNNMRAEVDQAVIPVVAKNEIRGVLDKHARKIIDMAKKAAAGNKKKAVETAVESVKKMAGEGKKAGVLTIDVGLDNKALQQAVDASLTAESSFSLIVFSSDAKKKKVMAYAGVSKEALDKGFDAPKWIRESLAICGGKGGGKPNRAQGQGPGIDKLEEAISKAQELASSLG
ncbi:alanine--tRNA ligase [Chloropicon primus]|uniref:Alanine--tRNA ligase n=1 Tax=Chloropicon primus TaxID=1764295 RepID=A0A5B8MMV0_9CHLO|nr:alanine--tRNA ligase [Chloropicon primus]|eukprot:QDZ21374.1 alanine--tRNA ligase [Chloropicon primus]